MYHDQICGLQSQFNTGREITVNDIINHIKRLKKKNINISLYCVKVLDRI